MCGCLNEGRSRCRLQPQPVCRCLHIASQATHDTTIQLSNLMLMQPVLFCLVCYSALTFSRQQNWPFLPFRLCVFWAISNLKKIRSYIITSCFDKMIYHNIKPYHKFSYSVTVSNPGVTAAPVTLNWFNWITLHIIIINCLWSLSFSVTSVCGLYKQGSVGFLLQTVVFPL